MQPLSITIVSSYRAGSLHCADQEKQTTFNRLVGVADRLFSETKKEGAATDIMRAAFQICPYCKNASSSHRGHFSEQVFDFEEFTDRRYMSEYIIPAIVRENPTAVLWVGVQVVQPLIFFFSCPTYNTKPLVL